MTDSISYNITNENQTVAFSTITPNKSDATAIPTLPRIISWNIIAGLTVAFNLANIIIILNKQRLRSLTHIIMASMFLADILFAITYLSPRFGNPSYGRDNWLYCTLVYNISPTIIIAINLHLLAVSVDKFTAIRFPVFYRNNSKPIYAFFIIATIWLISLIIGFLPVMTFRPLVPGQCIFWNMKERSRELAYTIFHIIFFYILPFIIMSIIYARIFCIARSFSLRLAKKNARYQVHRQVARQNSTCKKHYKTAKVLAILVSTYFVMWTPFYIYYLIFIFVPPSILIQQPGIISYLTITRYMAFCYPAANAIIYGYLIKDVRIVLYNCVWTKLKHGPSSCKQ